MRIEVDIEPDDLNIEILCADCEDRLQITAILDSAEYANMTIYVLPCDCCTDSEV